ncbi:hypothetical protein CC80DRAFT_551636 [Byssothecium circinans]|uniref:Uncharacterized protein n=1 Tax=Byssothecium circinans TaxID=147558 RepID=A0A6A5TKL1_9PLEO|nr:hypothetical protein CC80DRAFT_551636 [Byssothecium circinans]
MRTRKNNLPDIEPEPTTPPSRHDKKTPTKATKQQPSIKTEESAQQSANSPSELIDLTNSPPRRSMVQKRPTDIPAPSPRSSKKRIKMEEGGMAATGIEAEGPLSECANAPLLLERYMITKLSIRFAPTKISSLRVANMVVVKCGRPDALPGEWLLSKDLLRRESAYFRKKLTASTTEVDFDRGGAPTFELFLQWLHTGDYQEYSFFAQTPYPSQKLVLNRDLAPIDTEDIQDLLPWAVKAAAFAWDMGLFLGAPAFQNYAMRRLFEAFTRKSPIAEVDPSMLDYLSSRNQYKEMPYPICEVLEDIVIRNWGDKALVDSDDPVWTTIMSKNIRFCQKLARGTGIKLEERRRIPMRVEDYLVGEDESILEN